MSEPADVASITVRLRYFAQLREALGESDTLSLPASSRVADARAALVARGGAHAEQLGSASVVRAACNQRMCAPDQVLADGDELAFFPPVTGG